MKETAKINAMRSGVVVIGALAFGYLTLQLGFKPFLEKSQYTVDQSQPSRKDQLNLNGFDNDQTTHESLSDSISDS